jgi:hypothetical protein
MVAVNIAGTLGTPKRVLEGMLPAECEWVETARRFETRRRMAVPSSRSLLVPFLLVVAGGVQGREFRRLCWSSYNLLAARPMTAFPGNANMTLAGRAAGPTADYVPVHEAAAFLCAQAGFG